MGPYVDIPFGEIVNKNWASHNPIWFMLNGNLKMAYTGKLTEIKFVNVTQHSQYDNAENFHPPLLRSQRTVR